MAPIYDTDVAEKRFTEGEWSNYELWEQVEQRLRRRKWLWIAGTVILFIILSAIPIVNEKWPKWASVSATRHLAQQINQMKREAIVDHAAYRIRFSGSQSLHYTVEKSPNCTDVSGTVVRSGELLRQSEDYTILSPEAGNSMNLPGLIDHFCYDYLSGSNATLSGETMVGFGVISVKDLAEHRHDRMAVLLLSGPSAEISFE